MIRQQFGDVRGVLTHGDDGAGVVVDQRGRPVLVLVGETCDLGLVDVVGQFVEVDGEVVLVDDVPIKITVTRLEALQDRELSWRQLRGLVPDFTGGLSPAEFLNAVWGGGAG